ncbi:MAG: hypothetical protein ABIO94_03580 [Opitutaceae bacterium]
MKPSEREKLLRETLADDAIEVLRASSLARGVAAVQQRRRRRRFASVAIASACVVATLAITWRERTPPRGVAHETSPAAPRSPVEVLNDEQLLALFPERAVALVGGASGQQLIFLDESESRARPSRIR